MVKMPGKAFEWLLAVLILTVFLLPIYYIPESVSPISNLRTFIFIHPVISAVSAPLLAIYAWMVIILFFLGFIYLIYSIRFGIKHLFGD